MFTSAEIGKRLNLSPRAVNMHLANVGMLTHTSEGWIVTAYGKSNGGTQKTHPETGTPYVVWSEELLEHSCVKNLAGTSNTPEPVCKKEQKFRTFVPATLRTIDGHYVRTRAELLIDNWLYGARIVHAFEKKVHVVEEIYADFFLPDGELYIEYIGTQNNPEFADRLETKIAVYRKHRVPLIEIYDDDLENLDDEFPRKLSEFGVKTSIPFVPEN